MRFRPTSFPVLTLYALVLATSLGLTSVAWTTSTRYPLGAVRIGPWTVWPRVGSRDVDPYARAVMARTSDIPLGVGEGLMLVATQDDRGEPLDGRCTYRIGSGVPPTRTWTLTFYDGDGRPTVSESGRSGFTAAELLREPNGSFMIVASPEAQAGNWLPLPGPGRVTAILRLYDTPVSAGSAALDRRALPSIEHLDCLS